LFNGPNPVLQVLSRAIPAISLFLMRRISTRQIRSLAQNRRPIKNKNGSSLETETKNGLGTRLFPAHPAKVTCIYRNQQVSVNPKFASVGEGISILPQAETAIPRSASVRYICREECSQTVRSSAPKKDFREADHQNQADGLILSP